MLSTLVILVIQTRRWGLVHMFCPAQCFGIVRLWDWIPAETYSCIYNLTVRDTRRLTYIASDVRDRVRTMWHILTLDLLSGTYYLRDSNVCIKVNNCILMKVCWPEMPAHAHTRHFFGYSQEIITKISSLHFRLIFRWHLIRVYSVCS